MGTKKKMLYLWCVCGLEVNNHAQSSGSWFPYGGIQSAKDRGGCKNDRMINKILRKFI